MPTLYIESMNKAIENIANATTGRFVVRGVAYTTDRTVAAQMRGMVRTARTTGDWTKVDSMVAVITGARA